MTSARIALLLWLLLPFAWLPAAPVISEFSAAGQGLLMDEDEDFPDWIELHNPDAEPYSLTNHYITDDPGNLTKWEFPRGQNLRPNQRLLLFASRKDKTNIFQGTIHTNFALAASKGFIALVGEDGSVLHQWQNIPKQRAGVSYGLGADGETGYFADPTPEAPNGQAIGEVVKDTAFSVDRGFYAEAQALTISSETESSAIYFTLDGSEPGSDNGTLYQTPITIDKTAIVRAIAMKDGMISSNVDTHSYLFIESVLTQSESPDGFPSRWGNVPADYAFDTTVGSPDEFRKALLGYPTISLVMPIDSWFDPSRTGGAGGIYANSLEKGLDWEKAVSAEFINFEGSKNAQVDCGIRIYGNASRQTSRPKHNMRLAFRARYGASKLDFPVFGKGEATGINGLLFNGQNGDSWFHPALAQRQAASYIRDHFAHELLGDMGHLTPPQSRAHVYVNGLYWGFYQTVERVDQHFMARLLGGEPEEYDSMKASIQEGPTLVAGNTRAYEAMFDVANGGVADAAGYQAIQQYLDVDSFVDYMLINFWTGNRDWDHNNWRNGRHQSEGSPWHYFMWDSENIFKDTSIDRTSNNTADNPTRLHQELSKNPDYQLVFADHVQKHLFNDGLLTEEAVKARWKRWAEYVRLGLLAESARWGDHHRAGNPHTIEEDYEDNLEYLTNTMFPARAKNALQQFENRGLYPTDILPVEFSQHGGSIEAGFSLSMKAGSIFEPQSGDLVYTLDGTDPKDGGSIYDAIIVLDSPVTVKARAHDDAGQWGPLTETRFTLGEVPQPGELVISEIHYHPGEPTDSENPNQTWSRTDYEFLEIWNTSDRTLQLQGLAFTEGVRFVFPERSLAADERVLIVEDDEAFVSRYPDLDTIVGSYQGQLANGGEQLTLRNGAGEILHTIFFDDESPWPSSADGEGKSLILSDPRNPEEPTSWTASSAEGGSPGRKDAPSLSLDPGITMTVARADESILLTVRLTESLINAIVTPEGSDDLQTWSNDGTEFEKDGIDESFHRWRVSKPMLRQKRYYRFHITLE